MMTSSSVLRRRNRSNLIYTAFTVLLWTLVANVCATTTDNEVVDTEHYLRQGGNYARPSSGYARPSYNGGSSSYYPRKDVHCDETVEKEVIIVGAGMAGLAAAYKLGRLGISYRVIEAKKEVGGRIRSNSEWFENTNTTVEEGPAWIPGGGDRWRFNPVIGLADKYGVDFYPQPQRSLQVFRPNGVEVDDDDVQMVFNRYRRCRVEFLDRAGNAYFESYLDNMFYTQTEDQSSEEILAEAGSCNFTNTNLQQLVQYFQETFEQGVPPSEVSRAAYPEEVNFDFRDPSTYYMSDQNGGFQRVPQEFAEEYDILENIDFHTKCTGVFYGKDKSPAIIKTERTKPSGETCTQVYKGRYVIVTSSVGSIEHNKEIFKPEIDLTDFPMKMNRVERIYFQFANAFWTNNVTYVAVTVPERNGVCSVFLNYNNDNISPGSNILSCVLTGDELEELDGLTGIMRRNRLLAGLRNIQGYEDPTRIRSFDYFNDECFKGSWETWTVGGTYEDYIKNVRPRENLYLAGSAWCLRYWGYTFGAWLSGIYNADLIMIRKEQEDELKNSYASRLYQYGRTPQSGKKEHIHPYNPCFDLTITRRPEWRMFYLMNNPIRDEPYCPERPGLNLTGTICDSEEEENESNSVSEVSEYYGRDLF